MLPLWLNCNKIPSIKTNWLLWHKKYSLSHISFWFSSSCLEAWECWSGSFLPSERSSVGPSASTDVAARGQSWHRCTSPQLYSLAHMASDAPQPQITGLQKHHATLSRNTSKLGHLLFARNSRRNGTLRHWSQEKDICHVHQKGKVNNFRDVGFVVWCVLVFRWLGLEVQQSMRC